MLRYCGEGPAPQADVARVGGLDDAVVVEATGRMLLVEGAGPALVALVEELPDWVMAPETMHPVPDSRAAIKRRLTEQ